ncbi:MAG: hypothetical protein EBU90_00120 [Proteobacteria bacterium]|nr:hypothetical protein [Pseudomonadota bacterium]NBP12837.1 hypothetical protein [bacterium]
MKTSLTKIFLHTKNYISLVFMYHFDLILDQILQIVEKNGAKMPKKVAKNTQKVAKKRQKVGKSGAKWRKSSHSTEKNKKRS